MGFFDLVGNSISVSPVPISAIPLSSAGLKPSTSSSSIDSNRSAHELVAGFSSHAARFRLEHAAKKRRAVVKATAVANFKTVLPSHPPPYISGTWDARWGSKPHRSSRHRHEALEQQSKIDEELKSVRRSRLHLEEEFAKSSGAVAAMELLPSLAAPEMAEARESLEELMARYVEEKEKPCEDPHDPRDEGVSVVPRGFDGAGGGSPSSQDAKDRRELVFSNLLRCHIDLYRDKIKLENQIDRMLARGLGYNRQANNPLARARNQLAATGMEMQTLNSALVEIIRSSAGDARRYRTAKSQAERRVDNGIDIECAMGALLVPTIAIKWKRKSIT